MADSPEPMFDIDDTTIDRLDQDGTIYRAIAAIAAVHRTCPALRFRRMYFRETSTDAATFRLPASQPCTLAFSRLLARQEALVAYNTSTIERRSECVIVDGTLNARGDRFRFRYGQEGDVVVEEGAGEAAGAWFVRLDLAPMEFVILERAG